MVSVYTLADKDEDDDGKSMRVEASYLALSR